MTIIDTTKDVLNQLGISAFGIGIPILSPNWVSNLGTIDIEGLDPTIPTTGLSADMSLTLKAGTWACPIAGTIRTINPTATKKLPFPVTLVNPDGQIVQSKGLLLTLFPQVYVRLTRLYSRVLEQTPAANGQPMRPVPYYFFYDGETANINGKLLPSETFGGTINSKLRIYDRDGLPIDPVAVASAFVAIMQRFPILQHRDDLSAPAIIHPPLETTVIDFLRTQKNIQSLVSIRISDPEGKPDINSGNRLNGITNISGISNTSGLFTLDGNLTGTIAIKNVDANFSTEDRRLLMIGSTNGRLDQTFHPPALPAPPPAPATAINLYRDFFSIRIVQLKPFLLGNPISPDFKGKQLSEPQPTVCINEQLNLFTDGNDILASAIAALSNNPKEALCVAQTIDGNFPTPVQTGANAHWPQFPLPTGVPDNVALAANLRNQFKPVAAYFNAGNPNNISNIDVLLTLNGLPPDATVRIYPRKFIEDARATRGDGTGGIVAADGTVKLRLKDPLSLLQPGVLDNGQISVPTATTLFFDVMAVKRNGQARLYGNFAIPINNANITTADVDPTPTPGNLFGSAQRRGICNAGILGLGKAAPGNLPSLDTIFNLIQIATAFASIPPTGTPPPPPLPHEAPRLPTMGRRDLLVAGLAQNNNWSAVLAGGRLTPELHSAQPRLGSPGGLGGRETQVVGLSTANGRIAYDIARMALRRTDDIWSRLLLLADNNWNQPAEPPAPAANATTGAFAGVVLQTIAAYSETPKFGLLKTASLINRPTKFKDLVNWIDKNNDIPAALKGTASQLQLVDTNFLQNLANKLGIAPDPNDPKKIDPNNLLNNNSANPTLQRLYDELDRDLIASCYGRRDTQWAIADAISKARHFIYIETLGFTATQYPKTPAPVYAVDLIQKLIDRLNQAPGLHIMICTPKFLDYGPGYERFADHEANERWDIIHNKMSSDRVVAFHPIGFPGRPSRLESSTIIIDDQWALIGSSAFRRRGLTFDGSSDVVFTHTDLVEGRAIVINQFRQQLQNNRLGLQPPSTPGIPNPDFVRLQDGVEAFYLIREMLDANGLGTIEPLWDGKDPTLKPLPNNAPAITPNLANPDGQIADVRSDGQIDPASVEFDINAALLLVGALQGFP